MIRFLKRLFRIPAVEPRVRFILRTNLDITADVWRTDKELVSMAAKVLADGNVKLMLSTIQNSSPAWQVMPLGTVDERAIQQARIEGYTMAIANLESLGKYQPPSAQLESTYEKEELEETTATT